MEEEEAETEPGEEEDIYGVRQELRSMAPYLPEVRSSKGQALSFFLYQMVLFLVFCREERKKEWSGIDSRKKQKLDK